MQQIQTPPLTRTLADLKVDPERLLTEVEVCSLLGKSKAWAQRCRWAGTGPRYIKLGKTVAYRSGDVLGYIEGGIVETAAA